MPVTTTEEARTASLAMSVSIMGTAQAAASPWKLLVAAAVVPLGMNKTRRFVTADTGSESIVVSITQSRRIKCTRSFQSAVLYKTKATVQ